MALAEDITRRVHGESGLAQARRATAALFGGELEGLTAGEIGDIFADVPSGEVEKDRLAGEGIAVLELLAGSGLASSKGEARRAIQGGGIYVNGRRVDDVDARVTLDDTVEGRFLVLRKGKKNYQLIRVTG
jgi:tyrosyl-tRNA synthetase